MRPLTKETVEMTRQGLLNSEWCGFSKRDTVNQLCDLALAGLQARPETQLAAPTGDEIDTYRDTFRRELDKRMDTNHPSASPSTESHAIALRQFVENRNGKLR